MIDAIDRYILNIIQYNARVTNVEIARRIGRTPSGVLDRIRKLEQKRIIQRYETLIDPKALGLGLLAFVFVRVHAARGTRGIGKRIAEIHSVQEVHHLTGEDSFLCKVRCRDTRDLEDLLDRIQDIDGVVGTRVTVALRPIKETGVLPVQRQAQRFDPLWERMEADFPDGASIPEKVEEDYLKDVFALDLSAVGASLGITVEGARAVIPVFDRSCVVEPDGISDPTGKRPPHAVSVVLYKYLLSAPREAPEEKEWVAFRDFKDATPFVGAFSSNTERAIAKTYAGEMRALELACRDLGAIPVDLELPYELVYRFEALPRIPMLLLFNDEDEELPAKCKVLFERRACHYLDVECLGILGMVLAHRLRSEREGVR